MYANISGTWNDVKCSTPLPVICERGKIYVTILEHIHVFICVVYAKLLTLTHFVFYNDILSKTINFTNFDDIKFPAEVKTVWTNYLRHQLCRCFFLRCCFQSCATDIWDRRAISFPTCT